MSITANTLKIHTFGRHYVNNSEVNKFFCKKLINIYNNSHEKKSMITPTLKNITSYMPHKFQFRSYVKQFSYALYLSLTHCFLKKILTIDFCAKELCNIYFCVCFFPLFFVTIRIENTDNSNNNTNHESKHLA